MSAEAFDRAHLWRFRAKPLRVIDGDSLICLLDLGCHARYEARIRIADFDAPEWNAEGGAAATHRLITAMNRLIPSWEWPLRVVSRQRETIVSEVRSFERYVADVFVVGAGDEMTDLRDLLR